MTETTKFKVLIAEDDQYISRAYKDGLERAGFEIVLAIDGQEAVRKAVSDNPGLILLDLILPIKNGFEALEELKANEKTKNIPVIILTNLGQKSDIAKGKDLGAEDYLIKANLSMKEVIEKVKTYLPSPVTDTQNKPEEPTPTPTEPAAGTETQNEQQ